MKEAATFDEIGNALGISRQAAYEIYKAAMNKLRKRLRSHPEEAEVLWNFLEGSPNSTGYGRELNE